jgi:hypothetical protein
MSPGSLLPISTGASLGSRPANVAAFASGAARSEPPVSLAPLISTGNGAD